MRLVYINWDLDELRATSEQIRQVGHEVFAHGSPSEKLQMPDQLPDALVVSLVKSPSHGRAIAEWWWEAKKRRHLPLIFVDGKPDAISKCQVMFAGASYASSEELLGALEECR